MKPILTTKNVIVILFLEVIFQLSLPFSLESYPISWRLFLLGLIIPIIYINLFVIPLYPRLIKTSTANMLFLIKLPSFSTLIYGIYILNWGVFSSMDLSGFRWNYLNFISNFPYVAIMIFCFWILSIILHYSFYLFILRTKTRR